MQSEFPRKRMSEGLPESTSKANYFTSKLKNRISLKKKLFGGSLDDDFDSPSAKKPLSETSQPATNVCFNLTPTKPDFLKSIPEGYVFGQNSKVIDISKREETNLSQNSEDTTTSSKIDSQKNEQQLQTGTKKLFDKVDSEKKPVENLKQTETHLTGEENDINIIETPCKLFIMNTTENKWVGKGPVILRINDVPNDSSNDDDIKRRIVARLVSTQNVVINCFLQPEMDYNRRSPESLQLGLLDSQAGEPIAVLLMGLADKLDSIQKLLSKIMTDGSIINDVEKNQKLCEPTSDQWD